MLKLKQNNQTKIDRAISIAILCAIVVLSFEFGAFALSQRSQDQIKQANALKNSIAQELTFSQAELDTLNAQLERAESDHAEKSEGYTSQIKDLEGRVAGLSTQLAAAESVKTSTKYPFAVPTSGVIATFAGMYGGNMYGIQHFGIDIWTTTKNNGVTEGFRGNPVFSSCSGRVTKFDVPNGGLTVLCDPIPRDQGFDVPAYDNIYIYYGHLGHAVSKELFIDVREGDRVEKGQKIGTQGNLSSYFPNMRNVHLHYTIYSGKYNPPWNQSGGPYNPCIYIGGNCNQRGEAFTGG